MKKILSSLAGLTLIVGTTSGMVVACGARSTNQATQESNKVNGKNITLNDTTPKQYEDKSAADDADAIDQQLEQSGYLANYQAKDFHFDPSNNLKIGKNKVNYSVETSDGSTASGSLNVIIHPYKPTPPPPPTPSKAKTEADKVNGKSAELYDTASVKYENKTANDDASEINQQLENKGILTTTEAQDFHYDATTKLQAANNTVNYTVKASDRSTASGSLNVIIHPYKPTPPPPPTPSKAKTEANKVNGKTIDLNDTATKTYENQTAQADISAIDDALVKSGLLTTTEVKDFTFNSTVKLVAGDNNGIDFTVNASDHTQAIGSLNIHINPYKPTPPTPSKAQTEANKVKGKTIDLNDTSSVKYENKTANDDASAVKTALTQAGDITTVEAADFTFDNTKQLASGNNNNISFTVNASDKSTATGSFNIVINPYKPTPPPPPSPETAQAIAAKITNKTIWMNNNLGGSTNNPYTAQSILGLLKSVNSDNTQDNSKNLTTKETQAISLADATLTNQLQTVNATIHGANKTTAVVPLQIGLNPKIPANAHYAPFFDMGQLYKYNLNNLLSNNSINTITAAFLQHVAGKDVPTADDPVGLSWAGVSIDKNPKSQEQYTDLMNYKKAGGSYYISFGGEAGVAPWATQFGYSVADIQKSLQYVIDLYHPLGLDFDIEGGQAADTKGNENLMQAVSNLTKTNPKVQFSYTIAVAPKASADALNPLFEPSFDYLLNLPNAPLLNLMTMDYVDTYSDMYAPSIKCAQLLNQKVLADNKWGLQTAAEVNQHMSLTPMIGQNDSKGEVTTKNDTMELAHYEAINQMPRMSDWSLTRDNNSAAGAKSASYSGSGEYQDPYEFSSVILDTYGDSSQSDQPVSGSLTASNFAVFQDAITIDWKGATNVNYYNVYVDGSPVAKVNGQATGYAYYDSKLAQKPHQVKVVAVGAQGSSITSNTFTVDPSKSKLTQPLIEYDPTATYPKPTYVYYQGQVGLIKYWKGPGPMQPYQFEAMGKLSDYTNSLSPSAIADFTNNTMPGWYFTNNPTNK